MNAREVMQMAFDAMAFLVERARRGEGCSLGDMARRLADEAEALVGPGCRAAQALRLFADASDAEDLHRN